jgi:hypothetical protein
MSVDLQQLFVNTYSQNMELKLQQKVSKLRPHVEVDFHEGEQASVVDQYDAVDPTSPAGRFAPLNRTDVGNERRWVDPQDKELTLQVDKFDKLRMITDPEGKYVQSSAAGFGREWDRQIIEAFFASSKIGKTGTGTEAFDTANFRIAANFGAAGAVGLTVAKLIEAQKIFEEQEIDLDMDPATIVIAPRQHADLKNDIQVVSTDFNNRPVLVDGMVRQFNGFNIVISNKLTKVSNDRLLPIFVKSGMHLGLWADLQHNISQRDDLSSQPWQLYSKSTSGATRLEQGKVLQILCDET